MLYAINRLDSTNKTIIYFSPDFWVKYDFKLFYNACAKAKSNFPL